MRIEEHYGNKIVCGHIFPREEIKVGQRWQGSSGGVVKVEFIDSRDPEMWWVYYSWIDSNGERNEHHKDHFSFQCRYCLIVE